MNMYFQLFTKISIPCKLETSIFLGVYLKIFVSVVDAKGKKQTFPLREKPIIIGRSPKSHVVVHDELASSQHMSIYQIDDCVYIEDLKSKNGLFLNGIQIYKQRLYLGDKVKFGDTVLYFEAKKLDQEAINLLTNSNANRTTGELTLEIETFNDKIKRANKTNSENEKSGDDFLKNSKLYAGVLENTNDLSKITKRRAIFLIVFEYLALGIDIFLALLISISCFYIFKNFQSDLYHKYFKEDLGYSAYITGDALYFSLGFLSIGLIFFKWNRGKKRVSIGEKIFRIG